MVTFEEIEKKLRTLSKRKELTLVPVKGVAGKITPSNKFVSYIATTDLGSARVTIEISDQNSWQLQSVLYKNNYYSYYEREQDQMKDIFTSIMLGSVQLMTEKGRIFTKKFYGVVGVKRVHMPDKNQFSRIMHWYLAKYETELATQATDIDDPADYDQSMVISVPVSDNFGNKVEREKLYEIEDEFMAILKNTKGAIFDGHGSGYGVFEFFIYAKDVQAIYPILLPVIEKIPTRPIDILMRTGDHDDPKAKEISKSITS